MLCLLVRTSPPAQAALPPTSLRIAFIPLDDRPATELFPQRVAALCGAHLELPPPAMLGHFTTPGDPEALGKWLLGIDTQGLSAVVVSADMLAYGGLVASRTSMTPLETATNRVRVLSEFHDKHPDVPLYVFATIMRIAPTATPQAEPYLDALTNYARLAGVRDPSDEQRAALAQSRANVPDTAFWDYMGARTRDLAVDEQLLSMTAGGTIRSLAITQDDAGAPDGLQRAEQRTLQGAADQLRVGDRVTFNPGADEMGMVAVTRAIEDAVGWAPSADVYYSSESGANIADDLEDVPIRSTVGGLVGYLRLSHDQSDPDFMLYVRTPLTVQGEYDRFFFDLRNRFYAHKPTAIVDLGFIDGWPAHLIVDWLTIFGVASRPIGYASWNTTANSAGTALSMAVCSMIARRFGANRSDTQASFLFERYVEDDSYGFLVRPVLNKELRAQGVDVYSLGDHSSSVEARTRSALWPQALKLFDDTFAKEGWKLRRLGIYLPWQRTFEVQIDASLTRD